MRNSYYEPILILLSYDGEASCSYNPYDMTLKRFFKKDDDDLILSYRFLAYDDDIVDYIYVYKDNIITYCDSDSEDNAYFYTTEFSYGEFEKVYPTLLDEQSVFLSMMQRHSRNALKFLALFSMHAVLATNA